MDGSFSTELKLCEIGVMKRMLRVITFLIVLMIQVTAQAQTAAELEAKLKAEQAALDSLEARLASEALRLKQTQQKTQTESEALIALERNIFQVKNDLRTVQRQERDLARRLDGTQEQLQRAETRVRVREKDMARRLSDMYKLGRRGRLAVLFSSASFSDAVRRVRYLARVAEQDRRDYRALQVERRRVTSLYQVQNTQHKQQQTLLQGKLKKEETLNRLAENKSQTVQGLKQSLSATRRAVEETEAKKAEFTQRIAETIKKLQEAKRQKRLVALPPFDFDGLKGKLRRPVEGSVVTRFGRQQDPVLKTWTFNRGINIKAPEDTHVQSIAPGEVVMVDWFPGYGRFVLLRHPNDFYSLYGHLSSDLVREGEILSEGFVLGTVGSTGRLDGVPQLHFEIMKGEDPLDPVLWLGK